MPVRLWSDAGRDKSLLPVILCVKPGCVVHICRDLNRVCVRRVCVRASIGSSCVCALCMYGVTQACIFSRVLGEKALCPLARRVCVRARVCARWFVMCVRARVRCVCVRARVCARWFVMCVRSRVRCVCVCARGRRRLTGGAFEANLAALALAEGTDCWHFA